MKNIILAFVLMVVLQACTRELSVVTRNDTKWQLIEWPGKTLPTAAIATLNISGGNKIGGKSFCNTYGGNAVINGNAVQFSKIFGTKMYCEAVGDAEHKYYADLETISAGKVAKNKLYLYKNETLVMVFSKIK